MLRSKRACRSRPSYVADDLATWLRGKDMKHVRSALHHLQTQRKIERRHQTLKNRIIYSAARPYS
ncbi:hypothetical protein B2M20_12780 [Nitrobacter vulgaris]|uniref:Uncharacterized protein n=1 Tax=Nitrobacter vulgaris TaxID=29421 RepID=A0A1V4HWL5_NITVU|nr:hypothetical protein B2M20_12780 [Nitrobacter vulgaris]